MQRRDQRILYQYEDEDEDRGYLMELECQLECPGHAAQTLYLMPSAHEKLWMLWICNVDSQVQENMHCREPTTDSRTGI